jgi:transposase
MAYSEDFRRRAVELHKSGEWSTRELQELFGAAHTTVARWVRLEAATGG